MPLFYSERRPRLTRSELYTASASRSCLSSHARYQPAASSTSFNQFSPCPSSLSYLFLVSRGATPLLVGQVRALILSVVSSFPHFSLAPALDDLFCRCGHAICLYGIVPVFHSSASCKGASEKESKIFNYYKRRQLGIMDSVEKQSIIIHNTHLHGWDGMACGVGAGFFLRLPERCIWPMAGFAVVLFLSRICCILDPCFFYFALLLSLLILLNIAFPHLSISLFLQMSVLVPVSLHLSCMALVACAFCSLAFGFPFGFICFVRLAQHVTPRWCFMLSSFVPAFSLCWLCLRWRSGDFSILLLASTAILATVAERCCCQVRRGEIVRWDDERLAEWRSAMCKFRESRRGRL